MPMKDALDAFYFHNKQHSPQTQIWYTRRLDHFAAWCEGQKLVLEQITAKHIRQYIDELSTRDNMANGKSGKPLSTYTIHGHARIIRTFFNWLAMQEEFENVIDPRIGKRIPMPKIKIKVVETFTDAEIKRLFAACDDDFTWPLIVARNKAILNLLLDTGIRAGELCGLTTSVIWIKLTLTSALWARAAKNRTKGTGSPPRIHTALPESAWRRSVCPHRHSL